MDKNYEPRHIFLAIAVLTVIIAPLLLAFVPQTISNITHYQKGVWNVFAPGENFIVFGVGFFLIFSAAMTLFLMDIKKLSIIICVILVFLSMTSFFVASQSHKTLAEDLISYSPLFSLEEYTYSWDEVDKIVRLDYINEGYYEYEFVFTDGNSLNFKNNGYFRQIRQKFDRKVKEMDIAIEFYEIEE